MTHLLSITEVAELLGISRQSVHLAITEGRLKANKIGNQWTITEKAVSAYRVDPARKAAGEGRKK